MGLRKGTMKEIKCKDFQMLNMSLSVLFGKSPKCSIRCGSCGRWFSKRFDIINGRVESIGLCPYCNTINKVPVEMA